LAVTDAEELGSMSLQLAEPPSAPAMVEGEDGGSGSDSFLHAGASLSAPGGQTDPEIGQMCFLPTLEPVAHGYEVEPNPVLSDSGVPGGPPLLSESARRRLPPVDAAATADVQKPHCILTPVHV